MNKSCRKYEIFFREYRQFRYSMKFRQRLAGLKIVLKEGFTIEMKKTTEWPFPGSSMDRSNIIYSV